MGTYIRILTSTMFFGITASILGCFIVLKRFSLMTDTIAHGTLPGVIIGFILFGPNPFAMFIGGAIFGSIAIFCITWLRDNTTLKIDTILGLILSSFFGLGLIFMSIIQRMESISDQSMITKFILGNPLFIISYEHSIILILSLCILTTLYIFHRHFLSILFDTSFSHTTLNYNTFYLNNFLHFLLVILVSAGLSSMGVILMSTLVIIPFLGARQWSNDLKTIIIISGFIGAISVYFGVTCSLYIEHLPIGPSIAIILIMIGFFSLLFAPLRGLLWVKKYESHI